VSLKSDPDRIGTQVADLLLRGFASDRPVPDESW
jgi:hypothetical protein